MSPNEARRIIDKIVDDITSRRGIGDEWENIEPDIVEEIRNEWEDFLTNADES